MTVRVALAQMNAVVGDLRGNRLRMASQARQAAQAGVQVLVFPELALSGYPPEDLLLRPAFLQQVGQELQALQDELAQWPSLAVVVGHPALICGNPSNVASVLCGGRVLGCHIKRELPNYGVFDERRYFAAGSGPSAVFDHAGRRWGVAICEDAWFDAVPLSCAEQGAQTLLMLNASPWHATKVREREDQVLGRLKRLGLSGVYVNLVGGQDELVFDGASLVMASDGQVPFRLPSFAEALAWIDLDAHGNVEASGFLTLNETSRLNHRFSHPFGEVPPLFGREPTSFGEGSTSFGQAPTGALDSANRPEAQSLAGAESNPSAPLEAQLYAALVLALRDYIGKNGFRGVVLGLSGGIDSALVLALAVDALGADRVRTVMMPSRYTADISWIDAQDMANRLGVRHEVIAIEPMQQAFESALAPLFAGLAPDTTEENIQARIRGNLLMAVSNKTGSLVLTTGNKSELATGYCTLYGDMAGGFALIKDLLKTQVYAVSRWRNSVSEVIPWRIIERAPSAELRPDQTDQDSLPPYPVLDAILEGLMVDQFSPAQLIAAGHPAQAVRQVARLLKLNEYKRRQGAVGPKLSLRSFGRDWRMPITQAFTESGSTA